MCNYAINDDCVDSGWRSLSRFSTYPPLRLGWRNSSQNEKMGGGAVPHAIFLSEALRRPSRSTMAAISERVLARLRSPSLNALISS